MRTVTLYSESRAVKGGLSIGGVACEVSADGGYLVDATLAHEIAPVFGLSFTPPAWAKPVVEKPVATPPAPPPPPVPAPEPVAAKEKPAAKPAEFILSPAVGKKTK